MFLRVSSARNSLYSSSLRDPRSIIKAHLTLDTQTATGVFFFSHLCVLRGFEVRTAAVFGAKMDPEELKNAHIFFDASNRFLLF